jgi:hypothetical protein
MFGLECCQLTIKIVIWRSCGLDEVETDATGWQKIHCGRLEATRHERGGGSVYVTFSDGGPAGHHATS